MKRNLLKIMTAVIPAGVLLISALIFLFSGKNTSAEDHRLTFQTMGTTASFSFPHCSYEKAFQANVIGRKSFEKVVKIANLYDKNSELSRLNACAADRKFFCSKEMWQLLKEADFAFSFSEGAFDITVKPLMDLWGFYRKRGTVPSEQEISETMKKTGFDKLILNDAERSIRFKVKGMALDLGGIAKGYALDLAAQEISEKVSCGILDLGGNLKFLPSPAEEKKNYTVGIKDPSNPQTLHKMVDVSPGSAVSTSGDYERKVTYGKKTYGHIIDPVTGYPSERRYSATVISSSAMRADWLSTAVFLRGEALKNKIKEKFPEYRVILVKK